MIKSILCITILEIKNASAITAIFNIKNNSKIKKFITILNQRKLEKTDWCSSNRLKMTDDNVKMIKC